MILNSFKKTKIMNNIGKSERETQNRIVALFKDELEYTYLGNWEDQERTQPIEENLLLDFLIKSQGYSEIVAKKAVQELVKAATNLSSGLYEANKEAYKLLRYGVSVREKLGELKERAWFINWKEPLKNNFAFA